MTRTRSPVSWVSFAGILAVFTLSHSFAQAGSGPAKLLTDVPASAPSSANSTATVEQEYLQKELRLAGDYFAGRGVDSDLNESAFWYRKAVDQGDPGAQVELGYFYLNGIVVDRDATQ